MIRSLFAALLLTLIASLASPAFAAGIYKWVDKNGKTHFGDRPPADAVRSQKMKIRDTPQADRQVPGDNERHEKRKYLLQSLGEERAEKKQKAAEEKQRKKELARKCVRARHRLSLLKRSSYLYDLDESGKKVIRSDEDRDKNIREFEKSISKQCK